MKSISAKILAKIKNEEIKPIPEWRFSARNYLFIGATSILVLIGSLSLATAAHFIIDRDWQIYPENHLLFINRLILDLPYIWLALVLIALILIYINIHGSKTGYRYSWWLIIIVSLFFSLALGLSLNKFGIGGKLDTLVDQEFSLYSSVEDLRIANWSKPDEGYLGGKVISEDLIINNLILQDFQQKTWQIDISQTHSAIKLDNLSGQKIRIIGQETSDTNFKARVLYPWPCPCGNQN